MKDNRGRRLTRKQKVSMEASSQKLNIKNWVCIADDAEAFTIRHIVSGNVRQIKYVAERKR